ncbi:hypothetical protein CCP3SC1_50045 [Gammaproteobacteria bacterium]
MVSGQIQIINDHIHFHCVVFDGVFDVSTDGNTIVRFHEAAITNADIEKVQETVRKRIFRTFVRRGFIDRSDTREMLSWEHGAGFHFMPRFGSRRIIEKGLSDFYVIDNGVKHDILSISLTSQGGKCRIIIMQTNNYKKHKDVLSLTGLTPYFFLFSNLTR